jgi:predicted O-linked N-acetylglucosamine transferase (SPINDLY family)
MEMNQISQKSSKQETDGVDEYLSEIKRSMILFNEKDFTSALDIGEAALKSAPDRAEAYLLLGIIAFTHGRNGRALELFEKAHELDPECRDYAEALANVYTRSGRLTDGLYFAKLAGTLAPHPKMGHMLPGALSNYFEALRNVTPSNNHLQALRCYGERKFAAAADLSESELSLNRDKLESWRLLGRSLNKIGKFDRAAASFHAAIHMEPGNALDLVHLGHALYGMGRFSEALACHDQAREMAPKDSEVHASTLKALAYQGDEVWQRYRKQAAKWARDNVVSRRNAKEDKAKKERDTAPSGRKIRIGYISNRFFSCPESALIEPAITYYDTSRFEVYCYQNVKFKDALTTRLENAADRWRDISDIDSVTASLTMENDHLDILVDLCSYDEDYALELTGRRPASWLVGWSGQREVSGMPGLDVILSDEVTAKSDGKACLKDQKTVLLGQGLVALNRPAYSADIIDLPARTNNMVTFGGVCDLARISPENAAVWSDVIKATPNSRLFLGYVDDIPKDLKARAFDLFSHFGIAERVTFQEPPENKEITAPMDFFSKVDIMLDTFNVSGDVETCMALWMGVPVVSLAGNRRSALTGASILHAAGKKEWAASSKGQFIKKAAALAADVEKLESIRGTLRSDVEKSHLFSPQTFVRRLEEAYLSILAQ